MPRWDRHTDRIFSTWDEHTTINFLYVLSFLSGWIQTGLKHVRSSPQQESNWEVAAPQQRHDGSSWKWCKSSPSPPTQSPLPFFIIFLRLLFPPASAQIESRASLYEPGKTILRYDQSLTSAPLPPSSREIIYGPASQSESSNGSDGSRETGDSGHYSSENSHGEMSNPSSSRSSRPESFGLDEAELRERFRVEDEDAPSPALFHHSAPDSTQLHCTLEGHCRAPRSSQAVDSWRLPAGGFLLSSDSNWTTSTTSTLLPGRGWDEKKTAAAMMEMCFCLRSTSGLCVNVYYDILFPFFFLNNSPCLCLELSVLNQNSPIMNVKQAEKEKKCHQVLWHIFFLFNFFSLKQKGHMGATLTFYYLPPSSVIVHLLLPLIFYRLWCSIFLELRGQGHNNLPCLVRIFISSRGLLFLNSLEFSFVFTVVKELSLYHIWVTYVVTITSALDSAKLFKLYYEILFGVFSALNSKL